MIRCHGNSGQKKEGRAALRILLAVGVLVWAMSAAPPAGSEIYSWTDAQGVRRFSDRPPLDVDPRAVTKTEAVVTEGRIVETNLPPEPSPADEAARQAEMAAQAAARARVQAAQEEQRRLEAERAEAERIAAEKKKAARDEKSAAKKARIRGSGSQP